jgi:hypothetical protein
MLRGKLIGLGKLNRIKFSAKESLPKSNLLKDENGDLLAVTTTFRKCRRTSSHLRNVYRISDVRQIELHTTELLVPGSSLLEFEIVIAKLKTINCQVVVKF